MRVRLEIQRNELPLVKILWNLTENQTISKLLEQIHDVVPLESDGWDIEDYVVSVNGFECLHYVNVQSILKDEDEVR